MRYWTALVYLLAAGPGCSGPNRQTLDDVTTLYHDDIRWGRLPAAETVVSPALRAAFNAHHQGWGTTVQIMDMDVVGTRTAPGTGSINVRIQWTRGNDSTDLRDSTIDEEWETHAGAWQLRSERVINGDTSLFDASR